MRTTSTLSSLCCLASLVVLSGCKHVSNTTAYHNTVTEPVGVLVVNERAASPGVFVTVDENEMKPAIPARAESKPMRSAKPMPMPGKLSTAPATEPLNFPTILPTKLEKEKSIPLAPVITPASGIAEPLSKIKTISPEPVLSTAALGMSPNLSMPAATETAPIDMVDSLTVSLTIVPKSTRTEVVADSKAVQSIMPVGLKKLAELKTTESTTATTSGMVIVRSENPVALPNQPKREVSNIKSAHAVDYSWLIGELNYSSTKKVWRVRYAGVDIEDDFGGSVTLVGQNEFMVNAVEGQKVRVEGEIVDQNGSPSPRYLVKKMTLLN